MHLSLKMSAQVSSSGPTPTTTTTTTSTTSSESPSQETLLELFDSGIWYLLCLWPALHVACANSWGGPDTLDKRDWFAGAISELLAKHPDADAGYLEEFLLTVMSDEFETCVEDDSEGEVAHKILKLKEQLVGEGNLEAFRDVEHRWKNRGAWKMDVKVREVVQDVDGDVADDEEWVDGDGDVEMDDGDTAAPTPALQAAVRERPEPEVDEEGFTKVISRRKE